MAVQTIKLPDVGEGIAEAELTGWLISIGDMVREDDPLAEVMTDKVAVEIPSSVAGKVVWLGGTVGEKLAIGCDLVRIDDGQAAVASVAPAPSEKRASPMVRQRAKELGIDLNHIEGSGPGGLITLEDLKPSTATQVAPDFTDEKLTSLRRIIAQRMMASASGIPHFTIVEEVDVTALEAKRAEMNASGLQKVTFLAFVVQAVSRAAAEYPAFNAHYDAQSESLRKFNSVECGIATQTPAGLVVPVLRNAQTLEVTGIAAGILALSEAARHNTSNAADLRGSTITISSLGAFGGLATTPIINAPEVACIGVNKMSVRPHWDGAAFVPRKMINLSCSFDHRVIDGWDAALFIQHLKNTLESSFT